MFGSVRATISKSEWGPNNTIQLSSFFDGSVFGEMSDYEAQKGTISERMLRELQGQKYTAYAQERSVIFSIGKKELNDLTGNKKLIAMTERLSFCKQIDIFNTVSMFSMLPIVNKLISKTYKLG